MKTLLETVTEAVVDAFDAVHNDAEWAALYEAAKDEDTAGEEVSEALDAYNSAVYDDATPLVLEALRALGIECSEDGEPGDGVLGAGTVGSDRTPVVIADGPSADGPGFVRSPSSIMDQWIAGAVRG